MTTSLLEHLASKDSFWQNSCTSETCDIVKSKVQCKRKRVSLGGRWNRIALCGLGTKLKEISVREIWSRGTRSICHSGFLWVISCKKLFVNRIRFFLQHARKLRSVRFKSESVSDIRICQIALSRHTLVSETIFCRVSSIKFHRNTERNLLDLKRFECVMNLFIDFWWNHKKGSKSSTLQGT